MPSILLTDAEMDALYGLPFPCTAMYICLRKRMDYRTGRVGAVHSISWQALTEYLYIEGRPGIKAQSTSRWQAMRLAGHLTRVGLVRLESNPASGRLIFNLLQAVTDKTVSNKAARKPQAFPQGGDDALSIGQGAQLSPVTRKGAKPKAAQHPSTVLYHNAAAASVFIKGDKLIFPAELDKLSATQRGALRRTLKDNPALQCVLDELAGMMRTGKVRDAMAVFKTLWREQCNGEIIFSHAELIAAERELAQVKKEMLQFQPAEGRLCN